MWETIFLSILFPLDEGNPLSPYLLNTLKILLLLQYICCLFVVFLVQVYNNTNPKSFIYRARRP